MAVAQTPSRKKKEKDLVDDVSGILQEGGLERSKAAPQPTMTNDDLFGTGSRAKAKGQPEEEERHARRQRTKPRKRQSV